jgi:hypothetical protein
MPREAEPFGEERGFGRERSDVDADVGPEAEPE